MANKDNGTLKKARKILPICASAALLFSCQNASPNLSTAENYLEALRNEDAEAIADLTCLKDPQPREELTPGIESWDFVEESPGTFEHNPLETYATVLVKIRYEGLASPVENLFELTVWKTDDLYQHQLRLMEKLNQGHEETRIVLEKSREMLGEEPDPSDIKSSPFEAPSRNELTSQEYCVTLLKQSL